MVHLFAIASYVVMMLSYASGAIPQGYYWTLFPIFAVLIMLDAVAMAILRLAETK